MFMFCLLDRTTQIVISWIRAVRMCTFAYNCLILTTGCSTWHLIAKNSKDLIIRMVALHKVDLGYKKTLKLSYSTGQGHTEVFQDWFHLDGTGLARVNQRSWILVLCVRCRSLLQKTDEWVLPCSIALEVAEVEGQLVSA